MAETVPLDAPGVETGDWVQGWADALAYYKRVWADDALLATNMVLPFTIPAEGRGEDMPFDPVVPTAEVPPPSNGWWRG